MAFTRGQNTKTALGLGLSGRMEKINGVIITEHDFKYITVRVEEIPSDLKKIKFKGNPARIHSKRNVIALIGKKYRVLKSESWSLLDSVGLADDINKMIERMEKYSDRPESQWSSYNIINDEQDYLISKVKKVAKNINTHYSSQPYRNPYAK